MTQKKKIIAGLVILLVVAVCGYAVYHFVFKTKSASSQAAAQENSLSSQLAKACDVLTEDIAATALGGNVKRGDESSSATSSSDDIAVSQCVYTQDVDASVATPDSVKSLNLLVRSARTNNGKQANSDVFSEGKMPAGAEPLNGYGDKAYWNPDYGQLNILKNGNWYIIEYGPAIPSARTLDETKSSVNTLVNKL